MARSPHDTLVQPADESGETRVNGARKAPRLGRLRLIVALDALLIAGSVKGAAEQLGLSVAATSRLLGQIRDEIGDPIFFRSGKQMRPTPRAEAMRLSLRRIISEVEGLFDEPADLPGAAAPQKKTEHNTGENIPLLRAPPLAMRPSVLLDGQPTPEDFARRLAALSHSSDPRRRLARLIALMGLGKGHSRPLTADEAEEGLSIILSGDADPLQIGAFLQVMHYRGETAPELAGLVTAARKYCKAMPLASDAVDLDWPAYEFGAAQRQPWFLQAARLVVNAGYRVLIHGIARKDATSTVQSGSKWLGIPICDSLSAARSAIRRHGIAYVAVAPFAPQLDCLRGLYPLFQARSPIHGVLNLLNPLGAPTSLLGVPRLSAITLSRDVATVLRWPRLSVLASVRDVAELNPFKRATIYRAVQGKSSDIVLPAVKEPPQSNRQIYSAIEYWEAVWRGAAPDPRAEKIVIATTAIALLTIRGQGRDCMHAAREEAQTLWNERHTGP
jgi:anthranilate phosphoribosyltransferase